MYGEIKTNELAGLRRVFDEAINKGHQAMLTLGRQVPESYYPFGH